MPFKLGQLSFPGLPPEIMLSSLLFFFYFKMNKNFEKKKKEKIKVIKGKKKLYNIIIKII